MKYGKLPFATAIGAVLLFSNPALAEKYLSIDEVKALFSGKTFDGYNEIKDVEYQVYSNPDGTMTHKNAQRIKNFKWEVDDEGRHCAFLKRKLCGKIVDKGNGVYHKINAKGKHTNTLKNFREGNYIKID